MKISARQKEGIAVLDLEGKLTIGSGDVLLKKRVNDLISDRQANILLNLEGVDRMDSTGIGVLLSAKSKANEAGGSLKLINLAKRVREVLEITRLTGIFEIYEDEQSAVESFHRQ